MNLCSDGHDEICYESRYCPCCQLMEEMKSVREDYEARLTRLDERCEERIAKAEDHFNGLAKATLEAYKSEFGPDWASKLQ